MNLYQPGSIIIDRFELKQRLGAGAMGIVFGAIDRRLDEEIAIKFLPPAMAQDQDAVLQFAGEVRKARRVSGKYILRVYDMWDDGEGSHFVTMEWAKGGDLNSYRKQYGILAWEHVKTLLMPILRGLQTIHEAGIVHRDVKPGNILFRDNGTPIVADFGISKSIMASMSRISQDTSISGTPAYMAPEAIRGTEEICPATDLYAVGCMAYELLTGHTPFRGDPMSVMFNQTQEDPSFTELPGDAIRWTGACLIKDVNQRVQSVDELLKGLANPSILPSYIPIRPRPKQEHRAQVTESSILVPQAGIDRTYKVGQKPLIPDVEKPKGLAKETSADFNRKLPLILGSISVVLVILVLVVWIGSRSNEGMPTDIRQAEISTQQTPTEMKNPKPQPSKSPVKKNEIESPVINPTENRIAELEARALRLFREKNFTSGSGGNVWDTCREISALDPDNETCKQLTSDMQQTYHNWIEAELSAGDCTAADGYVRSLAIVGSVGDFPSRVAECKKRAALPKIVMAKCPHCGEMTEKGNICQECGESIKEFPVKCPNCGKWTQEGRNCIWCGHKLK